MTVGFGAQRCDAITKPRDAPQPHPYDA